MECTSWCELSHLCEGKSVSALQKVELWLRALALGIRKTGLKAIFEIERFLRWTKVRLPPRAFASTFSAASSVGEESTVVSFLAISLARDGPAFRSFPLLPHRAASPRTTDCFAELHSLYEPSYMAAFNPR